MHVFIGFSVSTASRPLRYRGTYRPAEQRPFPRRGQHIVEQQQLLSSPTNAVEFLSSEYTYAHDNAHTFREKPYRTSRANKQR